LGTGGGEFAGEFGGVLLRTSHEVLEDSIFASLNMAISIDVHFLHNVQNVRHAGVVVLDVFDNILNTIVLAGWGGGEVALDIAVVKWVEYEEEDVTTV
jgi:hypothetical protein